MSKHHKIDESFGGMVPLPQTADGVFIALIGDEGASVGLWVTREQVQSDLHSTASGILLLTVGGTPLEAMHK